MNEKKNFETTNHESVNTEKAYRFVSLTPTTQGQEYWESIDKGFDRAATDFAQSNLSIDKMYFNQYDVESFVQKTAEVIQNKPDAVIFSPVFRLESIEFIAELNKQNIHFAFVDSMIIGTNFTSYYGQNSFQSGYLAGKILLDMKLEKIKLLVLKVMRNGSESNQTTTRYEGFLQYIKDHYLTDYINIIEVMLKDEDEEYNSKILEKTIANNHDIKAVITFNSKIHRMASYANSDIRVVGYDTTSSNIRHLKTGIIYALIAQHPEKQSYLSIRDLYRKIVLNKNIKQINYLPMDVLYKENIDDYINFISIED